MNSFDEIIAAVRNCSPEQKQQLFTEIRDSIVIHQLEKAFGVRAEVMLESISRAPDLTQRGVRGVIAETVFAMDVLPQLVDWQIKDIIGNNSYDALVEKNGRSVRIQVKMQRKKEGTPWVRAGFHIVEIQKTRGGTKDGVNTRPYRFSDFDLLAVSMEPSQKDWHSFAYAPTAHLAADKSNNLNIEKYQNIPDLTQPHAVWSTDLDTALSRVPQPK